ncbi:jg6020 [Pararge aegeria aegeria]|uniref:Jg6020 protein n=1 Tax=Pararge aegeria aegeria TaxID=348720 RepID=A0A8S4SPU8_9NEOP|nr:jg6020 [Pararge aegeria aegeria]
MSGASLSVNRWKLRSSSRWYSRCSLLIRFLFLRSASWHLRRRTVSTAGQQASADQRVCPDSPDLVIAVSGSHTGKENLQYGL